MPAPGPLLMRPTRGFTLIELLVVIAIIMLLAAIAVPVISKASYTARRTKCLSNIRQIGFGMQQYAIDFSRHFPPRGIHCLPHWNDLASPALYPNYIKDYRILYCPISYERYNENKYWNKPGGDTWDYVWGYQNMANLHMTRAVFHPDRGVCPTRGLMSASDLPLLQDNIWHSVTAGHYNGAHPGRDFDPRPPHDVNVMFVDGRAEKWTFDKLSLRASYGGSYFYWP